MKKKMVGKTNTKKCKWKKLEANQTSVNIISTFFFSLPIVKSFFFYCAFYILFSTFLGLKKREGCRSHRKTISFIYISRHNQVSSQLLTNLHSPVKVLIVYHKLRQQQSKCLIPRVEVTLSDRLQCFQEMVQRLTLHLI
jgi:hypothetical protein